MPVPSFAYHREIADAAVVADSDLRELIRSTQKEIDTAAIINAASVQFLHESAKTRMAGLRWILLLHNKDTAHFSQHLDMLFPALLKTLSDPVDQVVELNLEVMAKIAANELYFDRLIKELLKIFSTDSHLLAARSALIIRQLSLFINPEKIYRKFSLMLEKEEEAEFASTMIQTLNLILLTSVELQDLRNQLTDLSQPAHQELFTSLYRSWAHNPPALFSLCLLSQVYQHAYDLIQSFVYIDLTVGLLIEIDKLVQLLESPVFISVRLRLLEPAKYPYLLKSLYGILMLLPQGEAFETLRIRLNCISTLGMSSSDPEGLLHALPAEIPEDRTKKGMDFGALLDCFKVTQQQHSAARRIQMKTPLS